MKSEKYAGSDIKAIELIDDAIEKFIMIRGTKPEMIVMNPVFFKTFEDEMEAKTNIPFIEDINKIPPYKGIKIQINQNYSVGFKLKGV